MSKPAFLNDKLSERTSILGLRLWVVLGICVGAAIVILLFLISLYFTSKSKRNTKAATTAAKEKKKQRLELPTVRSSSRKPTIPNVSKEVQEIPIIEDPSPNPNALDLVVLVPQQPPKEESRPDRIHIEIRKDHRIAYLDRITGGLSGEGPFSGHQRVSAAPAVAVPEVSHLGWGHWYTLRELEVSTNGFADENVIGEGGYGIVYRGVLEDNTVVAIKNLLNNRYLLLSYLII